MVAGALTVNYHGRVLNTGSVDANLVNTPLYILRDAKLCLPLIIEDKDLKKLVPTGSVMVNAAAGLCRMTASADGENYEIELPLERFLQLAAKAQQETRAYYIRLSAPNDSLPILSVPAIMPATIEIATIWTTETPKIAVTLDRATPAELVLSLSSDVGRALGEQLILRADELVVPAKPH